MWERMLWSTCPGLACGATGGLRKLNIHPWQISARDLSYLTSWQASLAESGEGVPSMTTLVTFSVKDINYCTTTRSSGKDSLRTIMAIPTCLSPTIAHSGTLSSFLSRTRLFVHACSSHRENNLANPTSSSISNSRRATSALFFSCSR